MAEAARQRKLVAPRITEVSGVDRPAHLRDGWFMRKNLDAAGTDALLGALGRGARMPKPVEASAATSLLKSLTGEQRSLLLEDGGTEKVAKALNSDQTAAFTKAAGGDFQPLLDQLAQVWQGLRDLSEKEDPDVPSTDAVDPATGMPAVAPVAPDAATVLASPALAKALGSEGVAMLKSLHERAEKAEQREQEAIQKALDTESATEFGKSFGALGLDAAQMGPALRKFADADPAAAEAIRKALTKAQTEQSGQRAIIVKEIGRVVAPSGEDGDTASGQVETIAKSLVASGAAKTIEQARVQAYQQNPDLYNAARNAGGE